MKRGQEMFCEGDKSWAILINEHDMVKGGKRGVRTSDEKKTGAWKGYIWGYNRGTNWGGNKQVELHSRYVYRMEGTGLWTTK